MRQSDLDRLIEIVTKSVTESLRQPTPVRIEPDPPKAPPQASQAVHSPRGLALIAMAATLTPREVFWWRICHVELRSGSGLIEHGMVGEAIPLLSFGHDFFALEQSNGIRLLKSALAESAARYEILESP